MDIDLEHPENITIFVDGSCHPNPNGRGGWAFHVRFREGTATRYGFAGGATNNQMEIMAIVRALEFVPASPNHTRPLIIASDSAYAISALTEWHVRWAADGWKTSNGSPVKNRKLVKRGVRLIEHHRSFREVHFVKVKGHSGIHRNERVDALANHARKTGQHKWSAEDVRNWL